MRIVRFVYRQESRYGLVKGDHVELLQGEPFQELKTTGVSVALGNARLLAPALPSKVIAVGLNYRDHADELGMDWPDVPRIFMKPSSSVIGPGEAIIYPQMSRQVDFEAELAVVIGKQAKGITAFKADQYILGYTCGNDITARDLQQLDGQWTRAKGFDTFCPLGPHIETDLDPGDLEISSVVNGGLKQSSRTSQMVFKVPELIEFITEIMTLYPGDVILTGTPVGIGSLTLGDTAQVKIEGIGTLTNPVA